MKILFIGDVVGAPGRAVVKKWLPRLQKTHKADLVIANGENLAGGKGITPETAKELFDVGVDVITSGNHIWDNQAVYPMLRKKDARVLRPANYPASCPGRGDLLVTTKSGKRVLILNIQGRTFMSDSVSCPFRMADALLKKYARKKVDAVFVDFHAEVTAEKATLRHYLDGRVTALVGTHTHVATADAHVTKRGTAFITDVGSVCAQDSSIGVIFEGALYRALHQMPKSFEIEKRGPFYLSAVVVTVDTKKQLLKDGQFGAGYGHPASKMTQIIKVVS